jgi:hypothetical protein
MNYTLEVTDKPTAILEKVERFLLDAMDLVEQRKEEAPVIAAYNAFEEAKGKISA